MFSDFPEAGRPFGVDGAGQRADVLLTSTQVRTRVVRGSIGPMGTQIGPGPSAAVTGACITSHGPPIAGPDSERELAEVGMVGNPVMGGGV